jgi:hypothetical protein
VAVHAHFVTLTRVFSTAVNCRAANNVCSAQKTLDSGGAGSRNHDKFMSTSLGRNKSLRGHVYGRYDRERRHASSTGRTDIVAIAVIDHAVSGLRRTHGVPVIAADHARIRHGRHGLCLQALRYRARAHHGQQGQTAARRGSGGISQTNARSRNQDGVSRICLSTARPSSPNGFASVSSISKWL